MATARNLSAKRTRLALLIADHERRNAFKDFQKLKKGGNKRGKSAIVRQMFADLTVHAKIEEELLIV
jgi:hypothetical protein